MAGLQHQVKNAQRRLWLNRWIEKWGWMLLFSTAAWTLLWLADRLLGFGAPMLIAIWIGLGVSVIGASVWFFLTRDSALDAATSLDVAAGLRERVSSALTVDSKSEDPFASAVVADAERAVAGLTPRRFIPLRWPSSLSLSAAMLVIALLSLLLPEFDLLHRREAAAQAQVQRDANKRATAALVRPVTAMQQVAEKTGDPSLAEDVKKLDALRDRKDVEASVKRREAMKTLDRLQDALKKQAEDERFKQLNETKKRLRQIGPSSDPKSEVAQLMDSLSKGDLGEAQNEIKKLQESLAKKAKNGELDEKKRTEMQKQLNELSKKLEQAAQDKQSQEELKKTGLSEAEAKRVLETLAKKDPQQLEKMAKELAQRLKDKGVSEQQMKDMLSKMQKSQKAGEQCKSMASKMGKAAGQLKEGNIEQAQQELGQASESLSEMEQMEQSLNDIESQMAKLDESREDMEKDSSENNGCQQCKGTGFNPDGSPCAHCNGNGDGNGQGKGGKGSGKGKGNGSGSGNRNRDDSVKTATVDMKAKTKEGRGGSIVGQQFVKGKQVKGQSNVEFSEAAPAAEINATDALNKDRIPRAYRESVKKFFDHIGDDYDSKKKGTPEKSDQADKSEKSDKAATPAKSDK